MALENLFIRKKRYLGNGTIEVQLDAVIKESHSNTIKITKNPVELGADITDHAIIEPVKLNIRGVVTDTPLGLESVTRLVSSVTDLFGSSTSEGVTRSQQAYELLIAVMNEREEIDIQTGLKLYKDMLITRISVDQDKETSKSVFLDIDAEEIIITKTEVEPLSKAQLEDGNTTSQAQTNNSRGRQESELLSDESADKKSFIKSTLSWLGIGS